MTIPQPPTPAGDPESFVPSAPGYPGSTPPGQPASPQAAAKRANIFTSKPVIGVAALVVGLILGTVAGGGNRPAAGSAEAAPTVTVTATETATYEATVDAEPTDEPDSPADDSDSPADTSYKYGQKVGFIYEEVEISVKIAAPKPSTNMFDKDNLEARITVCNKGSGPIEDMSAEGLGLYAEDASGGQYSLMGAYRSPEFPVYDYESGTLRAGKCRTGWISFEDGRKAVRIATEVDDSTYTWSKSGK